VSICADPNPCGRIHNLAAAVGVAGCLRAGEPQVFDVLSLLILHRDRVVPKEELLDKVWGDRFVSESALTSRIKAVRQAVGDDGTSQRFVQTIRGRGYRFIASVTELGNGTESESESAPTTMSAPSGVVTFLFTDVADSTELWAADREAMSASLQVHDRILRSGVEAFGDLRA
jgi:DNA-binding winged helix-turn-helix (wHTH) protein